MPRQQLITARVGTAAEWAATDPVLAAGEPGLELPGPVLKFGDGTRPWSTLPGSAAFTGHDALYRDASTIPAGTAALVPNPTGVNFAAYWAFDQTVVELVRFDWTVPEPWQGGAFVGRLGFVAPATGGNNVRWRWSHLMLALGGNPGAAMTVVGDAILAGPTGLGQGWTYGDVAGSVGSPVAIPANAAKCLTMIERIATGGPPNMAGDAGLTDATMTFVPT